MKLNRYIALNGNNNRVIAIRYGSSIVDGEIASDIGEIGQIMQSDGTFINDSAPQPEPPISELEAKINYIYLKQRGLI